MPNISKDLFLQPLERKTKQVELPEFGEGVFITIRNLDAKNLNAIYDDKSAVINDSNAFSYFAKLIAYSAIGEDGQLLFNPKDPKDLSAIEGKGLDVLLRVGNECLELSGIAADTSKKS